MTEGELSKKHQLLLRHPNGRALNCSIIGSRDLKKTVFYSHGFPASRIEAVTAHQEALKQGLTIVALDRPGFGASEWYPERRFEDWSEDVRLVADHLEVARFAVLGVSGGTPTAVAAAAAMPDRVSRLVVVSGVGPVSGPQALAGMNLANKALLRSAQSVPWLAQGCVWSLAQIWRAFPGAVAVWFGTLLPEVDRRVVQRRDVGIVLAKNIKEALSQGVRGTVSEFMLLASDWSDLLGRVAVPTSIWHGDSDTYVPISMGESLHRGITGSSFHKVQGGGHFMILDTMDKVLESIE